VCGWVCVCVCVCVGVHASVRVSGYTCSYVSVLRARACVCMCEEGGTNRCVQTNGVSGEWGEGSTESKDGLAGTPGGGL
jgi:hypothetical protein